MPKSWTWKRPSGDIRPGQLCWYLVIYDWAPVTRNRKRQLKIMDRCNYSAIDNRSVNKMAIALYAWLRPNMLSLQKWRRWGDDLVHWWLTTTYLSGDLRPGQASQCARSGDLRPRFYSRRKGSLPYGLEFESNNLRAFKIYKEHSEYSEY